MSHTLNLKALISGLFLLVALLAGSQTALANQASLYDRLGGKENIRTVMDEFVKRLKLDPEIGGMFAATDEARLSGLLTDQLCEAAGGPCKYTGLDMKTAHAGMNITRTHFNVLVEVMQDTFNHLEVPFPMQMEILDMLAPMHRDMVVSQ